MTHRQQIVSIATEHNRPKYCFLGLFFLVVIFIVHFYLFRTRYSFSAFLSEYTQRKSKLEILADKIWPQYDDKEDRIERQIRLGYTLADYLRKHNNTVYVGKKIILVTNVHYLWEAFARGDTLFRKNCPLTNCFLTNEIGRYKRTADAIIHVGLQRRFIEQFKPKPKKQIWIASLKEAPAQPRYRGVSFINNLINWTYCSRTDSTLVFRRYFPVDIYGRCGRKKCKRRNCREQLREEKYKFYLSFENSNCQDYITEKFFWNAFGYSMLPIVMGARRRDYAKVAPPHSYIHVDDFAGPRELAQYLHRLSNNDTEYDAYFQWKQTMNVRAYPNNNQFWCRLCTLLNLQEITGYTHWYNDFRKWWFKCVSPSRRNPWLHWQR